MKSGGRPLALGLTLDEVAGLARAKTRRSVTVLRDMNAEEFREPSEALQ
jgi:hypothetical protein